MKAIKKIYFSVSELNEFGLIKEVIEMKGLLQEYYSNQFRSDVLLLNLRSAGNVIAPIPRDSFYFNTKSFISCMKLINTDSHRLFFLVSIFITVCADQTMYRYYKEDYDEFKKLTVYPKFTQGDSLESAWQPNKNPIYLILGAIEYELVQVNELSDLAADSASLFFSEMNDFFKSFFENSISINEFFTKFINDYSINHLSETSSNDYIIKFLSELKSYTLEIK